MPIQPWNGSSIEPSPLESLGAPPTIEPKPGLFETTIRSAVGSIYGTVATQTLPRLVDRFFWTEKDPSFDPYKQYVNNEYLDSHPWMVDAFGSGAVDDIPNSMRYDLFETHQREAYKNAERLGQAGIGTRVVGGLLGSAPDLLLTAGVGEATGLAKAAGTVATWTRTGPAMAQAAKAALVGGAGNLAYEEAIRAANPNRVENETTAALQAFGMGAVFGTAVHSIGAGFNKLGQGATTRYLDRLRSDTAETLARLPGSTEAEALASLEDVKRSLSESPPSGVPNDGTNVPLNTGGALGTASAAEIVGSQPVSQAVQQSERSTPRTFDEVGADGRRHVTIMRTPETAPEIAALEKQYGNAVVFHEHPNQDLYDFKQTLDQVRPSDLGPFANVAAAVFEKVTPGGKLARSDSLIVRKAARLLMDYAHPTGEQALDPLGVRPSIPMEGMRDIYQGYKDGLDHTLNTLRDEAGKAGGFEYTFADGTTARFRSKALDSRVFDEAVTDYMRRARRLSDAGAVEAPAQIKKAAESVLQYTKAMKTDLQEVGLLGEMPDEDLFYLHRQWNTDAVRANRVDAVNRLVNDERVRFKVDQKTGQLINPKDRPIIEGVVDHPRKDLVDGLGLTREERATIKAEAELLGGFDKMTEDHLPAGLREKYYQEVDIYHQRRAEKMVASILQLENNHGVQAAMSGSNVLKERTALDETNFAPYLNNNIQNMLDVYHHKVSGELAARTALRMAESEWAPTIKEITGKDLAAENYNPDLMIEAVNRDFQNLIDAARKAGDEKMVKKLDTAYKRSSALFKNKMDELRGIPIFPNNPSASVGWRHTADFSLRQVNKFTHMAMMGKSAIGNFTDFAALALFKRWNGEKASAIIGALNLCKEVPLTRDIEGLYVAASDHARTLRTAEWGDITSRSDKQPFGPGRVGSAMAVADAFTDKLASGFTRASGLQRVNTNQKRVVARFVMNDVLSGAVQMARAAELEASGMSRAKAFAKVGLSQDDAVRLNRLGFNADRSKRLVAQLDKHAVDLQGNPVNADHALTNFVSPEMHAWANSDRDLFRALNFAVNSETMNHIVEPKLGSRPTMNQSQTGRLINMFQSFAFAWGNQFASVALQRPGYMFARQAALSVGMSALANALYNKLAGRENFDQAIAAWQTRPFGQLYAAVNRSPLLGWMQRPIGMLETAGFGPGRVLGDPKLSTAYGRRDGNIGDFFGPAFGWANNIYRGTIGAWRDGRYSTTEGRQLYNALPYHNLWQLEAFNRAAEAMGYDTPIGPTPRQLP